ncbi:MAG: MBL fold metallo-hydrolase [Candidatus Bilamarchaeaceae archaeon]
MRSKLKRLFIVVLLVFGLVIIPNLRVNSATNLSVHFINVGEGLSVLVKFPDGKTMLYDAGPYSERQTVVNYIKNQGVKKIDFLVFSHPDADHDNVRKMLSFLKERGMQT